MTCWQCRSKSIEPFGNRRRWQHRFGSHILTVYCDRLETKPRLAQQWYKPLADVDVPCVGELQLYLGPVSEVTPGHLKAVSTLLRWQRGDFVPSEIHSFGLVPH